MAVSPAYPEVFACREYVRLANENLKTHQRILDPFEPRTARSPVRDADIGQAETWVAPANTGEARAQHRMANSPVLRSKTPPSKNSPSQQDRSFIRACMQNGKRMPITPAVAKQGATTAGPSGFEGTPLLKRPGKN